MPVTSTEWTDFKATITFPATWNEEITNGNVGQKIFTGMGKQSDLGSSIIVDSTPGDSLYLAEEILYNITNEEVNGETVLTPDKPLTLKAELTNQIGLTGGLNQKVTWLAMTEDRKEIVDTISVMEDAETGNAIVSVTENTLIGKYVIVAYSEKYKAAKGIEVTVEENKEMTANVLISQDSGYAWMSAEVNDAECENVTFIIAAYSRDSNGNLTLLKVKSENAVVVNKKASVSELWLDEIDTVPSGTIIKAFVWETGKMKPIAITEESTADIIIK